MAQGKVEVMELGCPGFLLSLASSETWLVYLLFSLSMPGLFLHS